MKKRITALILTAMTLLSFQSVSYASDEETVESMPIVKMETCEVTDIELPLDRAIGMALENSSRINACDAKIQSATLSLEVVTDTQKEFDKASKYFSVPVVISEGLDTAYLKHGYYPHAAQVALDLATMEKEKIKAEIAYEVTEKYYNVKLMETLIDIANTGLQIAKDNQRIVNESFEQGYISALEVKNAENAVSEAQFSVDNYMRTLNVAMESLKISLQLDNTDYRLILTDNITIPDLPENYQDMIASAMDTRYDITALRKSFELEEEIFDITKFYVNDKVSLYHTAYSDYVNAKYTYDNTTKMIALSLNNDYASILSSKDDVTVAENNLSVKETEYESAKIKYEMGLMTNLELTAVMAELDTCKMNVENAKVAYLLNVLKFNYNTTIGI